MKTFKPTKPQLVLAALSLVVLAACTGYLTRSPTEQLYFALQIEDGDRVVARPQLLGETGKPLKLRLMDPGQPETLRLALDLMPRREGREYRVQLKLALPDREGPRLAQLDLVHGEERQLVLADPMHPLTVRLLMMRVASPEFEQFLKLARSATAAS